MLNKTILEYYSINTYKLMTRADTASVNNYLKKIVIVANSQLMTIGHNTNNKENWK